MRQLKRAALGAAMGVALLAGAPARATCSAEPMLGTICITAYNFCPRGYTEAGGQLLSIAQNTALFSLLGTMYGGNGQTTFGLPDLRGRVPRGVGTGPGLGSVIEGQVAGQENVTLTQTQMPAHAHTVQASASTSAGNADNPAGAVPAKSAGGNAYATGAANTTLAAGVTGTAGSSQPVAVVDPYLGLRYCIALEGIYPSRN